VAFVKLRLWCCRKQHHETGRTDCHPGDYVQSNKRQLLKAKMNRGRLLTLKTLIINGLTQTFRNAMNVGKLYSFRDLNLSYL